MYIWFVVNEVDDLLLNLQLPHSRELTDWNVCAFLCECVTMSQCAHQALQANKCNYCCGNKEGLCLYFSCVSSYFVYFILSLLVLTTSVWLHTCFLFLNSSATQIEKLQQTIYPDLCFTNRPWQRVCVVRGWNRRDPYIWRKGIGTGPHCGHGSQCIVCTQITHSHITGFYSKKLWCNFLWWRQSCDQQRKH